MAATKIIVRHHSNSRRFKCACGKKHAHWPDESYLVCDCGRHHVRNHFGGSKPEEIRR